MKRASYRAAIRWIVEEDDTEWVDKGDPECVTAALVADLFGVGDDRVKADIKRELGRARAQGAAA